MAWNILYIRKMKTTNMRPFCRAAVTKLTDDMILETSIRPNEYVCKCALTRKPFLLPTHVRPLCRRNARSAERMMFIWLRHKNLMVIQVQLCRRQRVLIFYVNSEIVAHQTFRTTLNKIHTIQQMFNIKWETCWLIFFNMNIAIPFTDAYIQIKVGKKYWFFLARHSL